MEADVRAVTYKKLSDQPARRLLRKGTGNASTGRARTSCPNESGGVRYQNTLIARRWVAVRQAGRLRQRKRSVGRSVVSPDSERVRERRSGVVESAFHRIFRTRERREILIRLSIQRSFDTFLYWYIITYTSKDYY